MIIDNNANYSSLKESLSLASSEYSRLISKESSIINKSQSCLILLGGSSIFQLSNLRLDSVFSWIIFIIFCFTVFCDFMAIKNVKRGEISIGSFDEVAQMDTTHFNYKLLSQYDSLIEETRKIIEKRKLYFNLTFTGICVVFLGLLVIGHLA